MPNSLRTQIYNNLASKDTDELLEIWQNDNTQEWSEAALEIVEEILRKRLGSLPPRPVKIHIAQILEKVEQYLNNNELNKALSECELALQVDPDSAIAHNYRGEIYDEMGQLEKAIADYQRGVQLNPEFQDAFDNLSSAEDELAEKFEESQSKEHLDLALEYAYEEEPEKALLECEAAKQTLPEIAPAYNYLGLILQALGRLDEAIEAYHKAAQLNPRFSAARKNLADATLFWEEEQYRLAASGQDGLPESEIEFDESRIETSREPLPQWLYMDKTARLVPGWPGHRTMQGRSGLDPLENDFEFAHIQGVILRKLWARKFRTKNLVYLFFMTFVGVLYFLYGVAPFALNAPAAIVIGIINSPYLVFGAALLVNVNISFWADADEENEGGQAFF
jgi:tetratricopeptide (TPR) repeat protein